MSQLFQKMLPKKQFARAVSYIAGGSAAQQLILIASSPVLTRLYSPENFGLFAVYAAILGVLSVIASLRYQLAIPLSDNDDEAALLVLICLSIVFALTCVIALLIGLFDVWLLNVLSVPELAPFLWLIPIGFFLTGIYQVVYNWALRAKAFQAISKTKVTQSLATVVIQISAHGVGAFALMLGHVVGQSAGSISLGRNAFRQKWHLFKQVRKQDVFDIASKYRRFPIYSSVSALLNKAGTELPLILFAVLFNQAAAGLYILAHRVMATPMKIIGSSVSDVFFSRALEARRERELGTLVTSVHNKLSTIALPPTLLLMMYAPELFSIIFGDDWYQSGVLARWMIPFLFIQFTASPLSTMYYLFDRQVQGAIFHAILLIMRSAALVVGSLMNDLVIAIALFSAVSMVCWIVFLLWIFKLAAVKSIRTLAYSLFNATRSAILIFSPGLVAMVLNWSGPLLISAYLMVAVLLARHYAALLSEAY